MPVYSRSLKHHKIIINPLDPASIDAAIKEVKQIDAENQRKIDLYLHTLAEIGQKAAQRAYSGSAVTVEIAKIPNGYMLMANGDQLGFLEWGAGAATDGTNIFAQAQNFSVEDGSWSREPSLHNNGKPGPYAQSGYRRWYYDGVRYVAIMPRKGMQEAYDAIQREARKKAMEIFK